MARTSMSVFSPNPDATKSVEGGKVTNVTTINSTLVTNGITIPDAFKNKNNSLQIHVTNSQESASKAITIKAGDNYPNKVLGDWTFPCTASSTYVFIIEDISRFENKDGSINIDFAAGFTGTIYATAKRAGVMPASAQTALGY